MARVQQVVIEKFKNDDWQETKIKHLVPGDVFRMWMYVDGDWELYEKDGETEFEAKSRPFLHPEHGLWTVSTEGELFTDEDQDN
jgi:hypothetical protein